MGNGHYRFNLSGLGLEGNIYLGPLPKSVRDLDLSNNNLSKIRFGDVEVRNNLRALNLQNNDNLDIDLIEIEALRSRDSCLNRLVCLYLSSNQLRMNGLVATKESIRLWQQNNTIKTVII